MFVNSLELCELKLLYISQFLKKISCNSLELCELK